MKSRPVLLPAVVIALAALAPPASAQSSADWHYYGSDLGSTRYAPLDQIHGNNASKLEIAWRFSTRNLGPRPDFNWRATPILVGDVLYTTAGSRRSASCARSSTSRSPSS